MKKLLILLILLTFASPAYAAATYKWIDEKGVVGYTDDFSIIPSEYRDQVSIEEMEETPTVGIAAPPEAIPPKIEEARADSYGLGESYWRERARPWKDQLKEARKIMKEFTKNSWKVLKC